jgi:hypothetical protein
LSKEWKYKPCSEGHKEHDNKCPHCVAVNGYRVEKDKDNG